MNINEAAVSGDSLVTLKEQKRLFDDLWLLTLFVILFAIGVPWFLRSLTVDLAPVAWSLFVYAMVYVTISLAANGLTNRHWLLVTVGILETGGVLFLGFLWHLTGSVQNPMFLFLFVVPLFAGSLLLPNWQVYATALLSVITVVGIALLDIPELRWYLTQLGLLPDVLVRLLPKPTSTVSMPFPGLNLSPSYVFVLLVTFCVMILTVAWTSDYLNGFLIRLYGRLASSAETRNQAQSLSVEMLRASPSPAALVYADTLNVIHASQSFSDELMVRPEALLQKNLLGLIDFSYPDVVEELVRGNGGEVPLAVYRVGGETRLGRVLVHPIRQGGTRYACVNLQDTTASRYLEAALDGVDHVVVIIGPDRQILYFNRAARELFSEMRQGADAAIFLHQASLPTGWWELGNRTRQERQVEFCGRNFRATCTSAPVVGEKKGLTVLGLHPQGGSK